jgi:hypothetical protein
MAERGLAGSLRQAVGLGAAKASSSLPLASDAVQADLVPEEVSARIFAQLGQLAFIDVFVSCRLSLACVF